MRAMLCMTPPVHASYVSDRQCRLSGQTHRVHTGVALALPSSPGTANGLDMHSFSCTTAVEFDALTPGDIKAYIATGAHADALPCGTLQGGSSYDWWACMHRGAFWQSRRIRDPGCSRGFCQAHRWVLFQRRRLPSQCLCSSTERPCHIWQAEGLRSPVHGTVLLCQHRQGRVLDNHERETATGVLVQSGKQALDRNSALPLAVAAVQGCRFFFFHIARLPTGCPSLGHVGLSLQSEHLPTLLHFSHRGCRSSNAVMSLRKEVNTEGLP